MVHFLNIKTDMVSLNCTVQFTVRSTVQYDNVERTEIEPLVNRVISEQHK